MTRWLLNHFHSSTLLGVSVVILTLGGVALLLIGPRLARAADQLADRTGIGEALMGALFVGASTSLSGMVVSVAAGVSGLGALAFSNALGGIAAQTMFLSLADITYRRANLEHVAASLENIIEGVLLLTLMSLIVVATAVPSFALWSIHPTSFVMPFAYGLGLHLVARARTLPMWGPRETFETQTDVPRAAHGQLRLGWLSARFAVLAALVAGVGYALAVSSELLVRTSGISQTVVGTLLSGVVTSLPELVTTLAAVRQGALTLAVGGILGGNAFDVLLVAFSDAAYREGPLYAALAAEDLLNVGMTSVMTGILVIGLLYRQRRGVGRIGFESALVLALYGLLVLLLIQR